MLLAACGSTPESAATPGGPVPEPIVGEEPPAASSVLFPIEDVFVIAGRGTVVTGKVARGTIRVGDTLELIHAGATRSLRVTGLEAFRAVIEEAGPGMNVGVLVQGVARDDVARGDVLATPGSLMPRPTFKASVTLVPTSEGGRKTPVFTGYRPMLVAWSASVTATIDLPAGLDSLSPGEQADIVVTLATPLPLELGTTFELREGGRTVGKGKVTGWAP